MSLPRPSDAAIYDYDLTSLPPLSLPASLPLADGETYRQAPVSTHLLPGGAGTFHYDHVNGDSVMESMPGADGTYGEHYNYAASNDAVDGEVIATATMLMDCDAQNREAQAAAPKPKQRSRSRKSVLTPHEALTLFAHKGIYVDAETGELRTSANHKCCDKWEKHAYLRHFTYKVYKKYEAERLDAAELQRLMDAKETYFRMNPLPDDQEPGHFRKKRKVEKVKKKMLKSGDGQHWMKMWTAAKNELKQLRDDLKCEADDEVRSELLADIEGLKKRKEEWATLLGLNPDPADVSVDYYY